MSWAFVFIYCNMFFIWWQCLIMWRQNLIIWCMFLVFWYTNFFIWCIKVIILCVNLFICANVFIWCIKIIVLCVKLFICFDIFICMVFFISWGQFHKVAFQKLTPDTLCRRCAVDFGLAEKGGTVKQHIGAKNQWKKIQKVLFVKFFFRYPLSLETKIKPIKCL